MAAASDKKISEGLEHIRLAEKAMKTGLLKWKPDYDSASSEYGKAAVCFKNAKAYEQAATTYLKQADCLRSNGSAFHAAKAMEAAALVFRDMKQIDKACDIVEQASLLYLEHGTPDTAALALERAAKMVEHENADRAIMLFLRAHDVAEMEDRPRSQAEMMGKAARIMIRVKRYDDAAAALTKEIEYYGQVENHGMLNKLVMGLVMIHLARGDYVAGDQAFKQCCNYAGFTESEEAGAINQLLDAYDQGDQEAADEILRNPLFRYMENDFTKLARDLTVPGGTKGRGVPEGAENDSELFDKPAEEDLSELL